MFEAVDAMAQEHGELERRLSAPETHADARLAKRLNQRYAELTAIITTWRDWQRLGGDLAAAHELAAEDPAFADEVEQLTGQQEVAAERLRRLLVPRDPTDDKDAILEIKSGEGGEESALFAGDLLKMYLKYAESQGWKAEILGANHTDMGGYKDVSVAVKTSGTVQPEDGVWDQPSATRYREMLAALRAAGIEPMVTLHHFTLPPWIARRGGWEWEGTPAALAAFAGRAGAAFGDLVDRWCTINEPNVFVAKGYLAAQWPPGVKDPRRAALVMRALLIGHAGIEIARRPDRQSHSPEQGGGERLDDVRDNDRTLAELRAVGGAGNPG